MSIIKETPFTVPRDMVMATLRWMGVPGVEVRMVKGTYEETKGRVVDVGLRQGSALLFISVVEVISRKASTKDILLIRRPGSNSG